MIIPPREEIQLFPRYKTFCVDTMKQSVLFLSLFFMFIFAGYAIPVNVAYKTYCQIDGTSVTLCRIGDEYFHCFLTQDGKPVLESLSGGFYYAEISGDSLSCSNILAHDISVRTRSEEYYLRTSCFDATEKLLRVWTNMKNNNNANSFKKNSRFTNQKTKYEGRKRGLIILVNFANREMTGENPNLTYTNMFNLKGYSIDNHIGSVSDYFYDQSYGKFEIMFDVVGPVTLSKNYGYYGQNINLYGGDKYPASMVIEACGAVDDIVDFTDYDWDDNGYVDNVFIVYAGYGEHSSSDNSTIWPHRSTLSGRSSIGDGGGALLLDGIIVDDYACASELIGSSGTNLSGIGTICHEFSHCLGLPDLYDTDYSGAFGMGSWDIMDSGGHSGPNRRGEIPYGYSAFERFCLGWLEFDELHSPSVYSLPPLNDCPKAYILYNKGFKDEFFIFENHQSDKWFSYVDNNIGMHGMMISHVDYNEDAWMKNNVNSTPEHMRASIIPADNKYGRFNESTKSYTLSESDYRGDLFPGSNCVKRFSSVAYKSCGGLLFNENIDGTFKLNKIIDNITEVNGVVSFSIGNVISSPTNLLVAQNKNRIEISWNKVEDAISYSIEIGKLYTSLPHRYETIIIDDIVDSKYILENIDFKQCNVRVKAVNNFASSEWSDYVALAIEACIITGIKHNASRDEYYDLQGRKIIKPVKKGIYIRKDLKKYFYN